MHRDLKPTNLFLPNGEIESVKIIDFGIARRLAASRAMTRTGMVIGTDQDISDFPSESVVRSAVTGAPKVGQACHKMVEVWCEVRSWRSAQYNSLRHRN